MGTHREEQEAKRHAASTQVDRTEVTTSSQNDTCGQPEAARGACNKVHGLDRSDRLTWHGEANTGIWLAGGPATPRGGHRTGSCCACGRSRTASAPPASSSKSASCNAGALRAAQPWAQTPSGRHCTAGKHITRFEAQLQSISQVRCCIFSPANDVKGADHAAKY